MEGFLKEMLDSYQDIGLSQVCMSVNPKITPLQAEGGLTERVSVVPELRYVCSGVINIRPTPSAPSATRNAKIEFALCSDLIDFFNLSGLTIIQLI
jgi:hypothetical protein